MIGNVPGAGHVAVVTGGASGIGLSIADLLVKHGAAVAILDLAGAAEAAKVVAAKYPGSVVMGHDCDVVDEKAVENVFAAVCSSLSRSVCEELLWADQRPAPDRYPYQQRRFPPWESLSDNELCVQGLDTWATCSPPMALIWTGCIT